VTLYRKLRVVLIAAASSVLSAATSPGLASIGDARRCSGPSSHWGLTCVEFRLRRGICVQPHEVGLEPTRCTRVPLHLPAGDSSWGKTPRSPAGTILVPMSVELIDASGTNCADNVNTRPASAWVPAR